MTVYALDRYLDQIRPKPERFITPHYEFFDTEKEAQERMISRARQGVVAAKKAMRDAERRLIRVLRKYGTPCEHGFIDQEQCGFCDDLQRAAAGSGETKEPK